MSRGPGVWQRAILTRLEQDEVVILTGEDQTPSEQNAIRRAAYTLERRGAIQLVYHHVDGHNRLIAARTGLAVPTKNVVFGRDGKTYRVPASHGGALHQT